MTWKFILAAVLLLGCILLLSSCYGTQKTLLFENRVYHWKIFFIKKSHLSVGTYSYFEVYYKERQLILPKEITDGKRPVGEFTAATAIDNRSSKFGTVILTFEGDFIREDNVPYRSFITLHIRPGPDKDLIITNPCSGAEIYLDPSP